MGLLNARNLRKAKDLLEKNRHKVGGLTEKAGEKLDKVSGGKTANVTSKAAEAAKKYSAGGSTSSYSTEVPVDSSQFQSGAVDPSVSQAQANAAGAAAANAIANMANAATNMMNNAAVQAQMAQAQQDGGQKPPKIQASHDPTGGKDDGADWSDDQSSS